MVIERFSRREGLQRRTIYIGSGLEASPTWNVDEGWIDLTVPQVHPYEVVRVDLCS